MLKNKKVKIISYINYLIIIRNISKINSTFYLSIKYFGEQFSLWADSEKFLDGIVTLD